MELGGPGVVGHDLPQEAEEHGLAGSQRVLTVQQLEAGFSAQIWARDLPPRTTSNVAAAIWYPYKAYPENLVVGWSAATYADFVQLAQLPETGVAQRAGMEIFPWQVEDP